MPGFRQRILCLAHVVLCGNLLHRQLRAGGNARLCAVAHGDAPGLSRGVDVLRLNGLRHDDGVDGEAFGGERHLGLHGGGLLVLLHDLCLAGAVHVNHHGVLVLFDLPDGHDDGDRKQGLDLVSVGVGECDIHGVDPLDLDEVLGNGGFDVLKGVVVRHIRHRHGGSLGKRALGRGDGDLHIGRAPFEILGGIGGLCLRKGTVNQRQRIVAAVVGGDQGGFKAGDGRDQTVPIRLDDVKQRMIVFDHPLGRFRVCFGRHLLDGHLFSRRFLNVCLRFRLRLRSHPGNQHIQRQGIFDSPRKVDGRGVGGVLLRLRFRFFLRLCLRFRIGIVGLRLGRLFGLLRLRFSSLFCHFRLSFGFFGLCLGLLFSLLRLRFGLLVGLLGLHLGRLFSLFRLRLGFFLGILGLRLGRLFSLFRLCLGFFVGLLGLRLGFFGLCPGFLFSLLGLCLDRLFELNRLRFGFLFGHFRLCLGFFSLGLGRFFGAFGLRFGLLGLCLSFLFRLLKLRTGFSFSRFRLYFGIFGLCLGLSFSLLGLLLSLFGLWLNFLFGLLGLCLGFL